MLSPNEIFQTQANGELVNQLDEGGLCLTPIVKESTLHTPTIEDSCDTYFDTDTEDCSMPADSQNIQNDEELYPTSFMVALKKVINNNTSLPTKVENTSIVDPYHIPNSSRFNLSPTSDIITPQKELKNLIKEVELNPVDSSDILIDKLKIEKPYIEVVEQPETTYRARYESEGCKGPIHGASENEFPTIKIVGYVGKVILTVYVVTRDNEAHLHSATGPGCSKNPCKTVLLDDNNTQALQMIMLPTDEHEEMMAVFDQLSIRRVRNWEADRELRKRGIDPSSWKSKKKEAKLAFHAEILPSKYHPGFSITEYSRSFLCTAPSGNPEIWWVSAGESPPEGGGEMGFIGKKFASGFKVRFFSKEDDGQTWEAYADIDRAKSNLNACVAKVPAYKETNITENVVVHVEIRVGSDKEPRCSDAYLFTYKPNKTDTCENCTQIKELLHRIFSGESSTSNTPNESPQSNPSQAMAHAPGISKSINVCINNANNNVSNRLQNDAGSSPVNVKDLLQLYKLKTVSNATLNNREMSKFPNQQYIFIPKTTTQQANIYPTGYCQINPANANRNHNLSSTQPSFVTIKVSDASNLKHMTNPVINTTLSNSSKVFPDSHLRVSSSNVLQETQMEVSTNLANMSKSKQNERFVNIPDSNIQFSNSLSMQVNPVACSIVHANSSNFVPALQVSNIQNSEKLTEVPSTLYETITVRNPLPITNTSSNQLVYSAVSLTPQVTNHSQQGIPVQPAAQNTAVAFIPTMATPAGQIVVTPLEKEIQMLTNRVQSLKKELESQRRNSHECTVLEQANIFEPNQQNNINKFAGVANPPENTNQFKNSLPIIQSCTSLLQTNPQQMQTKMNNQQNLSPQSVEIIQNQNSFAQLKLISPSNNFENIKFNQDGTGYEPQYSQTMSGRYEMQNKTFDPENNKIQNNIQNDNGHKDLNTRIEMRLQQPVQSTSFAVLPGTNESNSLLNINTALATTQVPVASHPQFLHHMQSPVSIESVHNQNTFADVGRLASNIEKIQPTPNESKTIETWEHRLSVTEAIASNKVGYSKECTPRLSRPPSPMEVVSDENNLLKTLQQLNNSGSGNNTNNNNNILSPFKTTPSSISMQSQFTFDKEPSNQIHSESFLDQNVSVDYSDSFKKSASNHNINSSSSWVPYQTEVLSYGSQTVFVNEDSTSQVW